MTAVFLRAIEAPVEAKAEALLAAIRAESAGKTRFDVDLASFKFVPQAPFSYWVAPRLRALFSEMKPFSSQGRTATVGLQSSNDFRFLRLWYEVERPSRYVVLAKGGPHAPYYSDLPLLVHWAEDGAEIKAYAETTPGSKHWSRNIRSVGLYFRPGITWPIKNRFTLKPWPLPRGCAFSHIGPSAFVEGDSPTEILSLHALMSASVFTFLVRMMAGWNFEAGVVQRVPVPELTLTQQEWFSAASRFAWTSARNGDTRNETSHAFTLPALLQVEGTTLQDRAHAWTDRLTSRKQELAAIQAEIDDRCFALYGIGPEDRQSIEAGFGTATDDTELVDEDEEADDDTPEEIDAAPMVASLLSWCVGVAFGRFDLRLATGARPLPPEPEPFDPLPCCSPGMLTDAAGLPLVAPPSGYPITFPADGILVDDPGHPRDLFQAVRGVFDQALPDANARWHETAEILGLRDPRPWFARTFFAEHVKRYSKSRRKAPIYWQLATPSASYSVWLYVHRATADTLFRVLNDFVDPKLAHERARLDKMMQDAGPNPGRRERDEIDAQQGFVGELVAMRAEVARVAPLWQPDLDDGVILNFAPLWRLVPHQRAWQNECKKAWDRLQSGDYDWAHLAMHLWPERVVPKCAEDRSLAIAHGLEDTFWIEDEAGKWQPHRVADGLFARLINERTSPAVKAALKELLTAAPPASGGTTRSRKAPRTSPAARTPPSPRETATASRPAGPAMDEATLRAVQAAIARMSEGASKADVQAATGLSDADWNKAIAALLARGSVTRTGEKRGTRYHATDEEG